MSNPFDWPALQCQTRPASLDFERGVWGKAHGAPTDFRWLARSDAFAADRADVHRQLNLGGEDVAASFPAWRNAGDRCYAVSAYPSRATDAAGRRGFLEKQVLEWRRSDAVPAALGALLLLPHVAGMTDAVWWDRFTAERWSQAEVLRIDGAERLAVDEETLAASIERGRSALVEVFDEKSLWQFYEQMLASARPAFLPGLPQPLPPEALAALLLPLPRDVADRVSLAGWIPTSRPLFADLANRWDGVVTSPHYTTPPMARPSDRRAEEMARQLLAGEPSFVAPSTTIAAPAPPPVAVIAVDSPRPNNLRPERELALTPPPSGAARIVVELYEFARSAERRWLTPKSLNGIGRIPCFAPHDPAARLLCEWVQHVRDHTPGEADPEQWQVKVDLLRSAALVLVPAASTLENVGVPDAESRVPALLFGLLLDERHADQLAGLGPKILGELLDQSFVCEGRDRWSARLRTWLREWERVSRRPEVRKAIDTALTSPGLAP